MPHSLPPRSAALLVAALCPMSLCAAAPAPEGTETTASFGASKWVADSSPENNATRYQYTGSEMALGLGVRHRFDSGFTLAGEATGAPGFITGRLVSKVGRYVDPRYDPSDAALHGGLALRAGWHGRFGGLELGAATLDVAGPEVVPFLADKERYVVPSAQGWVGSAAHVYAWGRLAAGPIGGMAETLALGGLGHAGEALHIEAGAGPDVGALVFGVQARPGLRVGLDSAASWSAADGDTLDWRALVRIQIEHKRLGEGLY